MENQIISYSALTIKNKNGQTHWGAPKKTLTELEAHLKRYGRNRCDVLIYAHFDQFPYGFYSKCIKQYWDITPKEYFAEQ